MRRSSRSRSLNDVDYRYSLERNTARFVIDLLAPPAKRSRRTCRVCEPRARAPRRRVRQRCPAARPTRARQRWLTKPRQPCQPAPAVEAATTDAASTEALTAQSAPVPKTEAEDAAKNTAPATKPPSKKRDTKSAPARGGDAEVATLLEKARRLIEDGDVAKGLSYLEVAAAALKNPKDKAELFLMAARTGKAHKLCAQGSALLRAPRLDGACRLARCGCADRTGGMPRPRGIPKALSLGSTRRSRRRRARRIRRPRRARASITCAKSAARMPSRTSRCWPRAVAMMRSGSMRRTASAFSSARRAIPTRLSSRSIRFPRRRRRAPIR